MHPRQVNVGSLVGSEYETQSLRSEDEFRRDVGALSIRNYFEVLQQDLDCSFFVELQALKS